MVRSLYSAIELITPDVWNWFEFSCLASAWVLALALELVLVFAAEVATFAVVADIVWVDGDGEDLVVAEVEDVDDGDGEDLVVAEVEDVDDVKLILRNLKDKGFKSAIVVNLTNSKLKVPVVRVIVPGLETFKINKLSVGRRAQENAIKCLIPNP